MIVCQHCRTENGDDAARCVSCGESPTLVPRTITASTPRDPNATATGFTYPAADMPAPIAPTGTKIANRYELLSLLGRGGMGLVYRARDLILDEELAIKLLQPHLVREVGDVERLIREIQTARKITHPNVIRIHDFGLAGEEGFITMEILPGGTLHERLAKGPIPVQEAVEIALGIADGLGAAHAQGVVHRDIKPHNVLFDASGAPKLADFGLARLASATSQTMGFSGTPQYMSPELADGREITARSDVYSLGVLLYELLVGKPPFQADSLLRLANMHSKEAPVPLRTKRPEVPPALEAIVMKALEKEPAHRFADARELAASLRDYKAGGTLRLPDRPVRSRAALYVTGGALAIVAACAAYEIRYGTLFGDGPAPTPTAVVAVVTVTATPPPTPTPTAAPATTALPSPTAPTTKRPATPKPTPTQVAVAPSPTAAPLAYSRVDVTAKPWAEVYIDGKLIVDETPARDVRVTPGKRQVRAVNPKSSCTRTVDVPAGEHLVLTFFMEKCEFEVSRKKSD